MNNKVKKSARSPKLFVFGCGVFLLVLGIIFSFVEQAPMSTVHSFTYGCVLKTTDFLSSHSKSYWTEEACYYHTSLSVIISCILGAGASLTFSGLKNQNSSRLSVLRTLAIPAISGVIILVMIFAVLFPIASCKTSEYSCIYDDTPEPSRLPLEAFEGFYQYKYDKGEITAAHVREALENEGYNSTEIERFLAERILRERP